MKNKFGRSVLDEEAAEAVLQNDDEAAEAEAARARQQGTELIETHLSHHLRQNPDSSYVTWIATLHPENADVAIDERFFVPGNAWWTVYEEAKNDIPTATAVSVSDAHDNGTEDQVQPGNSSNSSQTGNQHKTCTGTSPLASLVGFILALSAASTVLGLEAGAFAVYFISAAFFRLSKALDPPNICTGLPYGICVLTYWTLALVDSSLLLGSVITTELVAGIGYFICCLFGGCDLGAGWHQYMRRTCHLIRWAFRSKFEYPPRRFCGLIQVKEAVDVAPEDAGTRNNRVSLTPSPPLEGPETVVVDEKDIIIQDCLVFGDDCDKKDSV